MKSTYTRAVLSAAGASLVMLSGSVGQTFAAAAPEVTKASIGAPTADNALSVRLSPSQYRQSISDIFGTSIKITGRFEPETREQGLLAVGARKANVTDTGLQRYDELARGIALQVTDEKHRALLLPCQPRSPKISDDACARQFFTQVGRLLYRRPLTEQEVRSNVKDASIVTGTVQDFYTGLSVTLAEMLIAPEFLFRFKVTEPDPAHPGRERLDAYSKASELSFFLWNTTPDDDLLNAAASGEIHTREGLERQVNRLISSPRIEGGIRAFFSDMLSFSDFETLSKDPAFFPRYTLAAKLDSQEQTLRTIVDHLLVRKGDYRDLFTTRHTFLTRSLAALYGVPLVETTDNGQPQRWLPYTFPEGHPRAGLLAQTSFLALHSPSGRSSPTLRGKALRELLFCQVVPPPPSNVDFKVVQDVTSQVHRTARARLSAHANEAMCAGCHKITDPIGLALENFDSSGSFRTTENGELIDASGEINRVQFDSPLSLAKAIRDVPAVTTCVAKKAFAFGAGRMPAGTDPEWKQIQQRFADSNYNFMELLRQIALSDLIYSVPASQIVTAANH